MKRIHPQFEFVRGTTPELAFTLPVELDPEQYKVYITFCQNYKDVLSLMSGSDQIQVTGSQVIVRLTQDDTLAFQVGDVDVQIDYVKTDQSYRNTSDPIYGLVHRTSKDQVIP